MGNKTPEISSSEALELEQFLLDTTLFLAPDPEIMGTHDLAPRTQREERILKQDVDPTQLLLIRDRLLAGANEAFEMMEQMGAAPGAKWGDLITGIYSASGDLAISSTGGVLIFSSLVHHPVKFIMKYWANDPTVGVRQGDIFMHNDSRYGNIHNTDQSLLLPIFVDDELVAWAGATVHEGENGAIEPGGMPSAAESVYEEGLKLSPVKVGENYRLKKDWVTFLQNSVREPKLQYGDMKVKLFVCRRIEERVREVCASFSSDLVVGALRKGLEDVREEVKRRVNEWPDGKVRTVLFADGTLRENCIIKINLEMRKTGDKLTLDFRGSSPEFANRCNNTVEASLKGMICQLFLTFLWPDLPRSQAAFAPIEVITDNKSALSSSYSTPNAQSMMTFFPAFTCAQQAIAKMIFSNPYKHTKVVAPWYNMISTFIYGGITQHGEMVGNLCADLNGMAGGARADRDGEHSIAPIFASMADLAEQEVQEDEVPFLQITSKKLMKDNMSFGKYRGGMGYQMMTAMRGSPFWGFMVTCIGSKIPNTRGLFGGYACPTYPLAKIRNVNVFEQFKKDPGSFTYDFAEMMNTRPLKGADYSTHHMGLQFETLNEGELYMITQGAGGAYGDCLERDPEAVKKDHDEDLLSLEVARDIFKVTLDPVTGQIDHAATEKARQREREARKKRGVPFKQFVKRWETAAPGKKLPYYGSWKDRDTIYAGGPDRVMSADAIEPIFMPNPRDLRIAALEAEVARLQRKAGRSAR
jgi:acetone carboxylase alpha subunit